MSRRQTNSVYHQAEYPPPPRRGPDYAAALRAARIIIGQVYAPPSALWSHLRPSGDVGVSHRIGPYVPVPVTALRGYWGETYLRMQPVIRKQHPSGLPPETRLYQPRLEEESTGGR